MKYKEVSFIEELSKLKKPVWDALSSYLKDEDPKAHYKMVKEYPLRQGKYLRPGLLLLSLKLFGGRKDSGILTASAVQASEEWLLIHDDMEDHSEMRRGKPTLNAVYGDELAVNAGDAMHILMWRIMGDAVRKLKGDLGWAVYEKFNDILLKTTEGQFLELEWIRKGKVHVTEDEYLDMIRRKTSLYSVIGPLQLGAIISGASERDVKKIERWGLFFGYAFQIADDCLNIDPSMKQRGKEFAGDILEGKRTLILSHVLSHCSKEEKKRTEAIYRKPRSEKTLKERDYILSLIKKYRSHEYAKNKARDYAAKAAFLFNIFTQHLKDDKAKKAICAGIKFAVDREH